MSLSSHPRSSPARGIRCARSDPEPVMLPEDGCPPLGGCGGGCSEGADVLVVFVDHAAGAWLRLLKRGFRHCFAVLRMSTLWVACEPLKDRIDLDVLDLPPEFDLARFYAEQGHRVLLGQRPSPGPRRRFELAPLTCVTVVKRLLAIHAPWVCTPAHLHAHLVGPACGFHPWSERSDKAAAEHRPGRGSLAQRRA